MVTKGRLESTYTMSYDTELRCAILAWNTYVSEKEFYDINELFFIFILSYNVRSIISDSTKASHIINENEERWLIEDYIPRLVATGIKLSAIVLPKNNLIKMMVEDVVNVVEAPAITTEYFHTLVAAKQWIAQNTPSRKEREKHTLKQL